MPHITERKQKGEDAKGGEKASRRSHAIESPESPVPIHSPPAPAVPVRRLDYFLHGLDNFTTQFCVHLLPGRRVSVGKSIAAQGLAQGKDQGFAHVREVCLLHAKILVTLADLLEDVLYQLDIGSCVNTYKAIAKEKGVSE